MANVALIYRFGFAEMCDMDVAELMGWNARAIEHSERLNDG